MKIGIQDIDGETARNAKGELLRDRIATKRKIDLEFPVMTQTEMRTLLNAVAPVFFDVTYQDPMGDPTVNNGRVTKKFYVGDRTTPMLRYGNGSTDIRWEGVSFNLIEK